jgi:hypothetical protein
MIVSARIRRCLASGPDPLALRILRRDWRESYRLKAQEDLNLLCDGRTDRKLHAVAVRDLMQQWVQVGGLLILVVGFLFFALPLLVTGDVPSRQVREDFGFPGLVVLIVGGIYCVAMSCLVSAIGFARRMGRLRQSENS